MTSISQRVLCAACSSTLARSESLSKSAQALSSVTSSNCRLFYSCIFARNFTRLLAHAGAVRSKFASRVCHRTCCRERRFIAARWRSRSAKRTKNLYSPHEFTPASCLTIFCDALCERISYRLRGVQDALLMRRCASLISWSAHRRGDETASQACPQPTHTHMCTRWNPRQHRLTSRILDSIFFQTSTLSILLILCRR